VILEKIEMIISLSYYKIYFITQIRPSDIPLKTVCFEYSFIIFLY